MELKLEDYAQREGRMYYEIMREYADAAHTEKGLEIFIRPATGYLEIWHSCLKDDGTYLAVDHRHSLRGEDCTFPADIWRDMAKNPEPPWIIPKNTSCDPMDQLLLVPSFVYLEYMPKDETEYYRFGIPEPVTIHLSNVWVNEKVKEPKHSNKG